LTKINWNPLKENTSFIGAAQVGKTELAKKVTKMLSSIGYNVTVYAPHESFLEVDPMCVVRTLSELRGKGLQIYYPYENSWDDFNKFCYLMYSMKNQVVIWEELHNFSEATRWPTGLSMFARNCNNRNSGYMAIFQTPTEVPKFIIRNSMHRFCFYLDVPTDIDYMKRYIGTEVVQFLGEWPVESREAFYKKQGYKAVRVQT